jgi:hypothetical protein
MMRVWITGAALALGAAAAVAGGDSFSGPEGAARPPGASLYERIQARYAHLDRDVDEDFRDGPCRIERHWERDGDFEEHISCEGPAD